MIIEYPHMTNTLLQKYINYCIGNKENTISHTFTYLFSGIYLAKPLRFFIDSAALSVIICVFGNSTE